MSFTLRAPLKNYGAKIHSQNDEDGIISSIFEDIEPRSKFFVEFGIGPNWLDKTYQHGLEGNCVLLRERGWDGLFMDGGTHPEIYDVKNEYITAHNVNGLFRKYEVPENIDIVSIDVDGQDYWIWMALDYRPTLVIIELNPNFLTLNECVTVPFVKDFRWDGTKYYGASLGALVKLGKDKGYKLVYANGTNAFFVRNDMLANPDQFIGEDLLIFVDQHHYDPLHRPWVIV
jgi:hypothetical protein